MTRPMPAILIPAVLCCVLLVHTYGGAHAGHVDWLVFTPGGHIICSLDNVKERHGVCLLDSAPKTPPEGNMVHVDHLLRWRYYPGHMAAETEPGYLLLEERGHKIRHFHSEAELLSAVQLMGPALSPWLTPKDGRDEALFPFLVWEPCMREMQPQAFENAPPPAIPTAQAVDQENCTHGLDPARLRLYRLTTWGRICEYWTNGSDHQVSLPFSPPPQLMPLFCETILNAE
jgi:hypothetical protein